MKHFLRQLLWALIALDRLANVVFCDGSPNETMSGNCWRMEQQGKPWGFMRPVIDFIFWPGHCRDAYLADRSWPPLPIQAERPHGDR